MTRSMLKAVIKERLRGKTKAQIKAILRKKINPRYPLRAEQLLASQLRILFRKYVSRVEMHIGDKKPLYAVYAQLLRRDTFESEIDLFLREMQATLKTEEQDGLIYGISVESYIGKILDFVKTFDDKEIESFFMKKFGVPLIHQDEWWAGLRQQFTKEYLTRVVGSTYEYLDKIREVVILGVRDEIPFDKVLERIKLVGEGLSEKRANFIARDLLGKVNGLVTKNLQTGIGLTHYLWRTAFDERVRGRPGGVYADSLSDHWALDDKVCSWSDPNVVSYDYGLTFVSRTGNMVRLQPGQDWQCRCIAVPWAQDLVMELLGEG